MKLYPVINLADATVNAFPHPQEGTTLPWWHDAPERFYAPYVVEIIGRENASLTFRFLNLITNAAVGGSHTINLDDETVAWRGRPSTVDAPNAAPGQCTLLFLRPEGLPKPLSDDAIASRRHPTTLEILDTGKWPRSVPLVSEALKMLKALRNDVVILETEVLKSINDEQSMIDRASKLGTLKGKLDGVARALGAM